MRVFLDLNVILDVALAREPFAMDSRDAMNWCEQSATQTLVAFHSITNGYYLLRRELNDDQARIFLTEILEWVDIAPVTKQLTLDALVSSNPDVEDTLQGLCAEIAGADILVTRDPKGFRKSPVPAVSPTEFCEMNKIQ